MNKKVVNKRGTNKREIVPKGVERFSKNSNHLYSKFFRYPIEIKEDKITPSLIGNKANVETPTELKESRKQLLKIGNYKIVFEYKPEKLIIGSSLSPYTGDAITALHSIYGVPYIEGTSLKGLLKNCIIQESGVQVENEEWFKITFGVGSSSEETTYGQGNLVFFDSFPKDKFNLEKDIQTPHYGSYYTNEGKEEPTDCDQLNMFNFYVAKDTVFTIQIAVMEKALPFKQEIIRYMKIALKDYGLGGKTSVGYGMAVELLDVSEKTAQELNYIEAMKIKEKLEQERSRAEKERLKLEQERLEKLSPVERLIETIEKLKDCPQDLQLSKSEIYEEVLKLEDNASELAGMLLEYWESNDKEKKSKKQNLKIQRLQEKMKF